MKRVKITYRTEYDTLNRVCGYVFARVNDDGKYMITYEQYLKCLNHRVIGGIAGVVFDLPSGTQLWLCDNDGGLIEPWQ